MTGETGLEPATTRFGDVDSTIELLPYVHVMIISERGGFVKNISGFYSASFTTSSIASRPLL
jgi:hypothetical protein